MSNAYRINEIFYSLQGEGARAGCASVFVRFAGCNLDCTAAVEGFDCDTDHAECASMTADEVVRRVAEVGVRGCWVVLTGGEPLLQADLELVLKLVRAGHGIALETNGTVPLGELAGHVQHVACSPKPGHEVFLEYADEVRFVLRSGQFPKMDSGLLGRAAMFVSPAAVGNAIPNENVTWCVDLCMSDTRYALSVQLHKLLGLR